MVELQPESALSEQEVRRPKYLVAGERTWIRRFNRRDVDRWIEWPDHPDPLYAPYNPPRMSGQMRDVWYDDLVQRQAQLPFAVDNIEGELIGRIFLRFINRVEGGSVLGIDFNPRYVGQGYGTDALQAFVSHYFGQLGFHRLLLSVAAYNVRARHSYERCGFTYLSTHWERFKIDANVLGDDRYRELRRFFRRGRVGVEALFHTMVARG